MNANESENSLPWIPEWPDTHKNWMLRSDWIRVKIIFFILKKRWEKWNLNTSVTRDCKQERESETNKKLLEARVEMS